MSGIFTPTYLYVKRHALTGKLYFGKTTRDPEKYTGSGHRWVRHIKAHGKSHVETLWYCLFYDEDSIKEFGLTCSNQWNIVDSEDWLNFKPENGIDGQVVGFKHSIEARAKISEAGRNKTPEQREAQSKRQTGMKHKTHSNLGKEHKKFSAESKARISKAVTLSKTGKTQRIVTCPHCFKEGGINTMKQWHFDRCQQHTIGVN